MPLNDGPKRAGEALGRLRSFPRSCDIFAAFENDRRADGRVATLACRLLSQHFIQWEQEDRCRDPHSSHDDIALTKIAIDNLNMNRVHLVEAIDQLVSDLPARLDAVMHTETLGSVIDRLAIAWVRAVKLSMRVEPEVADLAEKQLSLLGLAYDSLLAEVIDGKRKLPFLRPLKRYGQG